MQYKLLNWSHIRKGRWRFPSSSPGSSRYMPYLFLPLSSMTLQGKHSWREEGRLKPGVPASWERQPKREEPERKTGRASWHKLENTALHGPSFACEVRSGVVRGSLEGAISSTGFRLQVFSVSLSLHSPLYSLFVQSCFCCIVSCVLVSETRNITRLKESGSVRIFSPRFSVFVKTCQEDCPWRSRQDWASLLPVFFLCMFPL